MPERVKALRRAVARLSPKSVRVAPMTDPADKIVRELMEAWASQDEAGEYGLILFGDDWRRFCEELRTLIERALDERSA